MEEAVSEPVAEVRLRWLSPQEGGRKTPLDPYGSPYAPTAYFRDDSVADLFSVVLQFTDGSTQTAELRLLVPQNLPDIAARLVPGTELRITEGARTVAECQVVAVRQCAVV
jgi:hypothetical protein